MTHLRLLALHLKEICHSVHPASEGVQNFPCSPPDK